MNTLGVERRWERTSKLGARFGVRVPLLALAACVVFAGSFAIARSSSGGTTTRSESPPGLPVVSVSAAIPASLGNAAPIESVLEARPAPPPPTRKAQSSAGPATSVTPSLPEAPAASPPTPPPSAPAPERATPAPVHEAPPPTHTSSGGGGHPSSGGGTFESSG